MKHYETFAVAMGPYTNDCMNVVTTITHLRLLTVSCYHNVHSVMTFCSLLVLRETIFNVYSAFLDNF